MVGKSMNEGIKQILNEEMEQDKTPAKKPINML